MNGRSNNLFHGEVSLHFHVLIMVLSRSHEFNLGQVYCWHQHFVKLQFTKYLRLTLVFMWNSAQHIMNIMKLIVGACFSVLSLLICQKWRHQRWGHRTSLFFYIQEVYSSNPPPNLVFNFFFIFHPLLFITGFFL